MSLRNIPEKYHAEIYDMYSSGMLITDIVAQMKKRHSVELRSSSINLILGRLKEEKKKILRSLLEVDLTDVVGKYRWLQTELEHLAIANRKNEAFFLKIADRLARMYEFQMSQSQEKPIMFPLDTAGRN